MTDTDRLFLLSLVVGVGCGADPTGPQAETEGTSDATDPSTTTAPSPSTSSSNGTDTTTEGSESTAIGSESTTLPEPTSTTDDTTSTTDDTTSTTADASSGTDTTGAVECAGRDASPFVVACCAMNELYEECYGYPIPPGYCEYYAEYFEAYGEACVDAITDVWTCLSMLECGAFGADTFPVECQEVALEAHAACPELIGLCSSGGAGAGMGFCEVEAMDCLDGHTYSVECMAAVCTCSIDDTPAGSFPGNGDSCFAPGFDDAVVDNCGFPPGLFE